MINGSSKVSGFQAKSGSDNVMVPFYQGAGCEPGLHAGLHIGNDRQPKRRDDLPRQSYLDSRGDDETLKRSNLVKHQVARQQYGWQMDKEESVTYLPLRFSTANSQEKIQFDIFANERGNIVSEH